MTGVDGREGSVQHVFGRRAFASNLTPSSRVSDNMVQDAAEKAWMIFGKSELVSNSRASLFSLLRQICLSTICKTKSKVSDFFGVRKDAPVEGHAHDDRLQKADFRTGLAQLMAEQHVILVLDSVSGFSYQEATNICRVAFGTIKSHHRLLLT